MRYGLIDMFFLFSGIAIGTVIGQLLYPHIPGLFRWSSGYRSAYASTLR
jgi:hypothetical protein